MGPVKRHQVWAAEDSNPALFSVQELGLRLRRFQLNQRLKAAAHEARVVLGAKTGVGEQTAHRPARQLEILILVTSEPAHDLFKGWHARRLKTDVQLDRRQHREQRRHRHVMPGLNSVTSRTRPAFSATWVMLKPAPCRARWIASLSSRGMRMMSFMDDIIRLDSRDRWPLSSANDTDGSAFSQPSWPCP